MKKLLFIVLFINATVGFSQNQGTLKGTVLDLEMQNEPLLFANVQLKGADLKTETNFHGNFKFDTLKSGTYTLVVSYAGYENIEMPIEVKKNEITELNLSMAAKQISFNGIAGLELSSKRKESSTTSERLEMK